MKGAKEGRTVGLSEELEYTTALDSARRRAKSLRNQGIKALLRMEEDGAYWDEPVSPITKIFLRRVKHLAFHLDLLGDVEIPAAANLPQIRLFMPSGAGGEGDEEGTLCLFPTPESNGTPNFLSQERDEYTALLAAEYMRANLDELDVALIDDRKVPRLGKEIFLCLYKMLRELFTVPVPRGTFGGAQVAPDGGASSMFITAECSRAIGQFATGLQYTASFLDGLHNLNEYLNRIDRSCVHLGDAWCNLERGRVAQSLKSIIAGSVGKGLLRLDTVLERIAASEDPRAILTEVETQLEKFIALSKDDVDAAQAQIDPFRTEEESVVRRAESRKSENADRLRSQFTASATAHDFATNILGRAAVLIESAAGREGDWREIGRLFSRSASRLREALTPVQHFADAVTYECLWRCRKGEFVANIQDLAFAASCSGAISGEWDRDRYADAFLEVSERIDEKGRIPVGNPFHISDGGREKRPSNANAIRAFAHLSQHVGLGIDRDTVDRIVDFFSDSARATRWGVAWPREGLGARSPSSPWVSVLSVIALHRIVRMLDVKINYAIFKHFRVLTPAQLGASPRIYQLMCPDLGLASLDWGDRHRDMVTSELERMRAHLLAGPRAPLSGVKPLTSMVLYGPPGTGKTTLIESLASSCGVPLVCISPSDFVRDGAELLDRLSDNVMSILCLLSNAVILFDEFDPIIRRREREQSPTSVFAFLTGNMLPRLSRLNKAAQENSFCYALATNFIGTLDDAAIRTGRFDVLKGVYPADLASRTCRLISQMLRIWNEEDFRSLPADWKVRAAKVIAMTGGVSIATLAKSSWLTAPKSKNAIRPDTAWSYLRGEPEPQWPWPMDLSSWIDEQELNQTLMQLAERAEIQLVANWNRSIYDDLVDAENAPDRDPDELWEELKKIAGADEKEQLVVWKSEVSTLREQLLGGPARTLNDPESGEAVEVVDGTASRDSEEK